MDLIIAGIMFIAVAWIVIRMVSRTAARAIRQDREAGTTTRGHGWVIPSGNEAPEPVRKTRRCPFCAEDILAEAVVCRFCTRDLPPYDDGMNFSAFEEDAPNEQDPPIPWKLHCRDGSGKRLLARVTARNSNEACAAAAARGLRVDDFEPAD